MPSLLTSREYFHSSIAQSVEQLTVNQPVPGSSPGGGVRVKEVHYEVHCD